MMKNKMVLYFGRVVKLSILFLFICSASDAVHAAEISDKLSGIVKKSKIDPAKLGISVLDSHGESVYALNENAKLIPASLTKIITAAAALDQYPVGFQFKTELRAQAPIKEGKLQGDLYLVGGGDPGFVSESMWFLVNEFLRTGVRVIDGDIVVDDTRFDSVRFDASRDQQRVDRAYDAPIGAMTFNWSAVNVYVRPGAAAGLQARVFLDPENPYLDLQNTTTTTASGKTQIIAEKVGNNRDGREVIRVSGKIAVGADEFVAYKAVTRPDLFAGNALRAFLAQRGVELKGSVRSQRAPEETRVLATFKSRPVGELVESMMKFSNNYIAEILTKNLAFEKTKKQGTMEGGVQVLRDFLTKKVGIAAENFDLFNPSGLSRNNKVRASDLARVLRHVAADLRLFPEFIVSLPIAGVDGTLKSRLKNDDLLGHVRGKTGHLSGVAGLAGYVGSHSGELYSYVFIFNGKDNDAWAARDMFDGILQSLVVADKKL